MRNSTTNDLYQLRKIAATKDYALAEHGDGFVIPGPEFLASLAPDEPAQYVALLRYKQGELRANHYHKHKVEHLIVLDGVLVVELRNAAHEADSAVVFEVAAGDVLTIQPECHHVVTAKTDTAAALELSPQKLDLSDVFYLTDFSKDEG